MMSAAQLLEIEDGLKYFFAWAKIKPETLKVMFEALLREVKLLGIETKQNELTDAMDVKDCMKEIVRLRKAIQAASNEIGVPQPEYPAPIANASQILTDALALE